MIKIIRVGRERLREAYEIVNKVDQGMNVPEWFVAETYEEFDFWMKKERGLLYLAVDEEGKAGAMFFVILPGAHPEGDLRQIGYRYLLCTVHPENVFSRSNVMKQGYQKMLTKEKYGGFLRDIWMKNIIE